MSAPATSYPARFMSWIAFAHRPENDGQPYHVTPGDHGGPTAWGITSATWFDWTKTPMPVGLTAEQALPELFAHIWIPCAVMLLPGVDLMTADAAMLSGVGQAVTFVQRVAHYPGKPDGVVGPVTVKAVGAWAAGDLVAALYGAQCQFYADLNQAEFVGGWERRCFDRLQIAKAMAPDVWAA